MIKSDFRIVTSSESVMKWLRLNKSGAFTGYRLAWTSPKRVRYRFHIIKNNLSQHGTLTWTNRIKLVSGTLI